MAVSPPAQAVSGLTSTTTDISGSSRTSMCRIVREVLVCVASFSRQEVSDRISVPAFFSRSWERLREEKGATEDEMVERHQQPSGHEFEQTLGGSEGQGSPACCGPWGHKESDTTEHLNKNSRLFIVFTERHSTACVKAFLASFTC